MPGLLAFELAPTLQLKEHPQLDNYLNLVRPFPCPRKSL